MTEKYEKGKELKSNLNENPFVASLFWNNLPRPYGTNLGFLESSIRRYRAIKIKTPYFIFTGMDKINLEWVINDVDLVTELKKNPIHFYLFEPVIFNIKNDPYNLTYYSEFINSKNKKLHAVELDYLEEFAKKINANVIVHTCDYNINRYFRKKYKHLNLMVDDLFIKTNSKPFYGKKSRKNIKKHFWAANVRYAPHRHLIMNYLANKDGNYSWYFNSDIRDLVKTHEWIESEKLPWDTLHKNNELLNKSKFVIDVDVPKISIVDYSVPATPSMNGFSRENKFIESFNECFCAIINETRFAQPTGNFSEKTFGAMMTYTPFIVAAPPYTLEYLKDLGFKTFNEFWDESYDLEENHTDRLVKIYNLIDYINSLSMKECKKMYKSMKSTLNFNFDILNHNKIVDKRFFK